MISKHLGPVFAELHITVILKQMCVFFIFLFFFYSFQGYQGRNASLSEIIERPVRELS